ncbi:hypothetical protein D3C81_2219960 [compost metagenome]
MADEIEFPLVDLNLCLQMVDVGQPITIDKDLAKSTEYNATWIQRHSLSLLYCTVNVPKICSMTSVSSAVHVKKT